MTTKQHVQQPRILDQGELDARIEKAVERYKGSHASCQAVDEPILLLYTKKVIELVAAGYSLNEKLPCRSGNIPTRLTSINRNSFRKKKLSLEARTKQK